MKKEYLVHAVWVLLAGGAFALGKFTASPNTGSDDKKGAAGRAGSDSNGSARPSARSVFGSGNGRSSVNGGGETAGSLARPGVSGAVPISTRMEEAVRTLDPIQAEIEFLAALENLTPDNAPDALAAIRANSEGWTSARFTSLLYYRWGQLDPMAAVEHATEQGGRSGAWSAGAALSGWAANDPVGAQTWVGQQEEGDQKRHYVRGLVTGLARSDPNAAQKYIEGLPEGNSRTWLMQTVARARLREGVESAANWAASIESSELRSSAMQSVASQFVRADLDKAIEWGSKIAQQENSGDAVAEVAEGLTRSDPARATKWLKTLPPGEASKSAAGEVFQEWGRKDPEAASGYLNNLPAGEVKDSGINSFSRTIMREDAEAAATWSLAIGDEKLRRDSILNTASYFYRRDKQAATVWMNANALSADLQKQITTRSGFSDRG